MPNLYSKQVDYELLQRCKRAIQKTVPDAQLILYGSRARGDANDNSDYDLLVLVNGPVDWRFERLIRDSLYDLELESDKILSVQVLPLSKWNSPVYRIMPFRNNVEREGLKI